MSFLPEDDVDYLSSKGFKYVLKEERPEKGILISDFPFVGNLYELEADKLLARATCELLILIPEGYSTTRLDNFYTRPFLKKVDRSDPTNANGRETHFGLEWQFWSRHLTDEEWKKSARGLEVWIPYVRAALQNA